MSIQKWLVVPICLSSLFIHTTTLCPSFSGLFTLSFTPPSSSLWLYKCTIHSAVPFLHYLTIWFANNKVSRLVLWSLQTRIRNRSFFSDFFTILSPIFHSDWFDIKFMCNSSFTCRDFWILLVILCLFLQSYFFICRNDGKLQPGRLEHVADWVHQTAAAVERLDLEISCNGRLSTQA